MPKVRANLEVGVDGLLCHSIQLIFAEFSDMAFPPLHTLLFFAAEEQKKPGQAGLSRNKLHQAQNQKWTNLFFSFQKAETCLRQRGTYVTSRMSCFKTYISLTTIGHDGRQVKVGLEMKRPNIRLRLGLATASDTINHTFWKWDKSGNVLSQGANQNIRALLQLVFKLIIWPPLTCWPLAELLRRPLGKSACSSPSTNRGSVTFSPAASSQSA